MPAEETRVRRSGVCDALETKQGRLFKGEGVSNCASASDGRVK